MYQVLPSFHTISRWNSLRSLCDTGKTVLSTFKANINNSMAFVKFEDSAKFHLQDECLEVAIWFVCFPYDKKIKNATTNDLRRAAYQCFLWEHVSDKGLDLPSPMKNGKVISEGRLEPIYMILEENCFAVHVLLMSKRKQNQHCTCQKVNLMYTNVCRCNQTDFVCKNIGHFDINEDRRNE